MPQPAEKASLLVPMHQQPGVRALCRTGRPRLPDLHHPLRRFAYSGIYTSVITCFVVSLSTVGASTQKRGPSVRRLGRWRRDGDPRLMYVFPHVETLGGFWAVFATGTALAAWVNFGSPRLSYGGYQIGLAFYKVILQGGDR